MSKLHVGDMVRVKEGLTFKGTGILHVEEEYCGKTFRVKRVIGDETAFTVRLDKDAIQYAFSPEWLEPVIVGKERIVIRHDGKTVTAMLYNGKEKLKEGMAKCHPDDPFDFMAGAKIALERLMGKEPEKPSKYHSGQIVRVLKDKMGHGFEIGSLAMLLCKAGENWKALGFCTDMEDEGIDTMYISENEFVAID